MITVDAHMDIPWLQTKRYDATGSRFNLTNGDPSSMFTIQKAKEGGLDTAIFALYLSDTYQDEISKDEAWGIIKTQRNALRVDKTVFLTKFENLPGILEGYPGHFPFMLALEGGRLIHENLDRLDLVRQMGVKYLTLTHNRNTAWAGSATDYGNIGLSQFGVDVIKECNAQHIVVDVSHSSDKTAMMAIDASTNPVAATHSGVRSLVHNPRNLSDDLIKAIAETGGIICVPYVKKFIGHYSVADHIDHIVGLVGAEHVGIGSDLDGATLINGFKDVSDWKKTVYNDLVEDGVNGENIAGIMGGNLLRILKEA